MAEVAPRFAEMLTVGGGFPDLAPVLDKFREEFDWCAPKPATTTTTFAIGWGESG